jgi:hypothetical protein
MTSGNREVFEAALACTFGDKTPSLVAGNHIGLHPYIVDSHGKAVVAEELRSLHKGCKILEFGDSSEYINVVKLIVMQRSSNLSCILLRK